MEDLKDKYKIILSERIFNKNFLGIGDAMSGVKSFVGKLLGSKPRMEITRSGNPNYQAARKMVDARNRLMSDAETLRSVERFQARRQHPSMSDELFAKTNRLSTIRTPTAGEVESAAKDIRDIDTVQTNMYSRLPHFQQVASDKIQQSNTNLSDAAGRLIQRSK